MNPLKVSPMSQAQPYFESLVQLDTPLLLLDAQQVENQYRALSQALPNVQLFYAIKSQPELSVLRTLASLGAGFDIATNGEIERLSSISFDRQRCIHTHPIKRPKDIRTALRFGCTTFVVDNLHEMEKFLPYRQRVGLLLRVSYRNPGAVVDLSKKFGCALEEAGFLLRKAQQLGLTIKGLSFHVGSQCQDAQHHAEAILAAAKILQDHRENTGQPISILDIGGGFPVDYGQGVQAIEAFCAPIRRALRELPSHFQVWAEPGRFLSAPAGRAVSRIIGKARRGDTQWYYLDDGVYGSYSGQIYDHMQYPLEVFSDCAERERAVLAGPTCDSIDVIAEGIELPPLNIGDLVIGHCMGAYTSASATDFNLFERAQHLSVNSLNLDRARREQIRIA